jgi:CRP/FNR family cyclic AMP-dependent transcriptional regulator
MANANGDNRLSSQAPCLMDQRDNGCLVKKLVLLLLSKRRLEPQEVKSSTI